MAKLGIDIWGLVWQAIAFGMLVFVLYRLMYKPMLKAIDERAAKVRHGMEDADRARKRSEEAQREFDQKILEARRKGQETVADATRTSEKVREEILAQARHDSVRLVQEARQQIETEQKQALASVREQIIDLSIDAARKVLQQQVDESAQRRLIQRFLAEAEHDSER